MARDFQINGECLVQVKGAAGTSIATLQELGLAADPITVTLDFRHRDINVDAWGGEVPADVQVMLAGASVSMNLIHLDRDILDVCLRESQGGSSAIGRLKRAGARMGNNAARFAATNHYIGLNLTSPVQSKPWRFYFSYLTGPPVTVPLGTEKSVYQLNWRIIPYTRDPYNSASGAEDFQLYDHTLDT